MQDRNYNIAYDRGKLTLVKKPNNMLRVYFEEERELNSSSVLYMSTWSGGGKYGCTVVDLFFP